MGGIEEKCSSILDSPALYYHEMKDDKLVRTLCTISTLQIYRCLIILTVCSSVLPPPPTSCGFSISQFNCLQLRVCLIFIFHEKCFDTQISTFGIFDWHLIMENIFHKLVT